MTTMPSLGAVLGGSARALGATLKNFFRASNTRLRPSGESRYPLKFDFSGGGHIQAAHQSRNRYFGPEIQKVIGGVGGASRDAGSVLRGCCCWEPPW